MRRAAREESRCRRGTGGGEEEREADASVVTWGIRLGEEEGGNTEHSYDAIIFHSGKRNK